MERLSLKRTQRKPEDREEFAVGGAAECDAAQVGLRWAVIRQQPAFEKVEKGRCLRIRRRN